MNRTNKLSRYNRTKRSLFRRFGHMQNHVIKTTKDVQNMNIDELVKLQPTNIKFKNINMNALSKEKKTLMLHLREAKYRYNNTNNNHVAQIDNGNVQNELNQLQREVNKNALKRIKNATNASRIAVRKAQINAREQLSRLKR